MASVKNDGWALAAACAAAGLFLAGCDASNSTTAAQKAGQDAAVRAMSAGEPRAKDKLLDEVAGIDAAAAAQLKDRLSKAASIGDYVQQNATADDLKAAITQLQGALALNPSAATKAGLQMQLAAVQLQLSDARAADVQSDIMNLDRQAAGILDLAQKANDLNAQAAALEKSNQPPSTAGVDGAKAGVAERQKALTDLQATVRDLQAQMTAKESKARQIYADTSDAFTAADALKGKASIDAGNKAMEDRKQAEVLMAESGALAPVLAQAQAEMGLAQKLLDNAQQSLADATAAYNKAGEASGAIAEKTRTLHATAASIVDSEGKNENGLTARVGKFAQLAGKLGAKIRDAADAADAAANNFGAASGTYTAYTKDLEIRASDQKWSNDDPLRSLIKDLRTPVLIMWSKSAAEQQAGRLCLAGAQTLNLVAAAMSEAARANVKAPSEIPADMRSTFAADAAKKYQNAVASVKMANERGGGDLDKIKWIGYTLQATAEQGAYLSGNRAAGGDAVKSRDRAVAANPNLVEQLRWIGQ